MNAAAVAVIGMAGRFPGAPDVETYWANLLAGVESVVTAPGVPGGFGVLEAADHFDADYFGCSPLEALVMDPQHRLLLECAVEALEHAGHGARAGGPVTGVFAGASQTDHLAALLASRDRLGSVSEYQLRLGSGMDFLTTRVTYKLDLRGPGVTVQTACSTSLAAIHLAAQALLAGECEIALAGGVCAHVPPPPYSVPEEGGILAPDGRCRAFDARATGTVGGNAVGFVVLRPLDEALAGGDHIHAVLRGSAMNNDGSRKVGYTAPSVDGQAAAIAAAHAVAEVEPDSIGYVEAHGTGTPVGDPIEIAGLTLAFGGGAGRRGLCRIGSVKTNIGHTDAAAGVAGFIKAVLAVERGVIPPSLHFTEPNPECRLPDSPFEVCTEPFEWPDRPRRAGVSSFGIGGTNVHAVLEEPPAAAAPGRSRPYHLVPVSARTDAALDALTGRLTAHLRDHPAAPLADVAWTLQTGRHA
ncbi:MAG TPA: polyketide synthase, partial [Candidatus Dormibacteraeota bacterium]|nr:polyketide synthase [Candidatus Dormibacteraeota bacterium]